MTTPTSPERKFPTGTLVFGLVLVVVALATLSHTFFNWRFDTPLFFIVLVALAGLAMVISGVMSATRRQSDDDQLPPSTH